MYPSIIYRSPKVSVIDITSTNPEDEGIEVAWRGVGSYLGRLDVDHYGLAIYIATKIDDHASTEAEAQAIFDSLAPAPAEDD